ncbi:MAG: TIGR03620 family F420-dependent LLM class oxidoreductase [Chloroflexota bacterium]|nr:TIGR03620 family F420-dependent LLM class oxidoreductase [Chloroflexota bacterium]
MFEDQPGLGRRTAARIGRLGVWTSLLSDLSAQAAGDFVRQVEQLGFATLWLPEGAQSKEILSHSALLLGATRRLIIAPGIANIWARDPVAMANGARTLGEAYPGRFLLGLGVSHAPAVARRGGHYRQPVEHMRQYLDAMSAAECSGPLPIEPVPVVLAALGPRMLRLASQRTAGAHPYFVPVEHTGLARLALGPEPVLAVEQAVVLEADPERARQIARIHTQRYLRLDNYVNNLRRLGWSEADLADAGSDSLVDAVVAWGATADIDRRVAAHYAAGADHVCVQVLTERPDATDVLEQLALLHQVVVGR